MISLSSRGPWHWLALLALVILAGCSSLPETMPVTQDADYQQKLPQTQLSGRQVFLAPISLGYKPTPLSGAPLTNVEAANSGPRDTGGDAAKAGTDDEAEDEQSGSNVVARYQMPMTEAEQVRFQKQLAESMALAWKKSDLGILPAGSIAQVDSGTVAEIALKRRQIWCRDAEDRGGQLLVTAELLENSVSFKGQESSGWTLDLLITLAFFPLNIYVHDEIFDVRQTLRVGYYDVRNPEKPIHEAVLTGEQEWVCDELDHGYIFLNAFSSGENYERFEETNWRSVYELLQPHASRKLHEALVADCFNGIGERLKTPAVIQQLDEGNAETARLYVVAVGQDGGFTNFARRDAEDIHDYLAKHGVSPANSYLGTGKLTSPEKVLEKIQSFQTKKVDRLLFYFAGQGRQNLLRQELLFENGKALRLDELAKVVRARNFGSVAFVFDCSFGDPARARIYSGRSDKETRAKLPSTKVKSYLLPLRTEGNWRVLCAARHDATAPEIPENGHGLLSWLVLQRMSESAVVPTLDDIQQGLTERYSKLCRTLIGYPAKPFIHNAPRAKAFRLGQVNQLQEPKNRAVQTGSKS